jgi:putative ABC transport system ATP-binding protein
LLTCKDLCLSYHDGTGVKQVLTNVNLEFKQGENAVFIGPSGSGKSSLIYLLSCLREPTSGEVFLNNASLSAKKNDYIADLRKKHFAFVFQMHFLIPYLTTLENVLVAKNDYSKKSKEEAADLLEKLGLSEHIGKKTFQMSGGQRQRVAIARALINEPDIIFADEPTASLDHQTATEVIEILKNHKKDSILIMATHDTSILSGDERQIKVADGTTIEL